MLGKKQFSTRLRRRKNLRQKILNGFSVFLLVALPVYPAFGSYVQSYTGVTIRGDYDSDTIISAYQYGSTGNDIVIEAQTEVVNTIIEESIMGTPVAPAETVVVENPQPQDTKRPLYATHTVAK